MQFSSPKYKCCLIHAHSNMYSYLFTYAPAQPPAFQKSHGGIHEHHNPWFEEWRWGEVVSLGSKYNCLQQMDKTELGNHRAWIWSWEKGLQALLTMNIKWVKSHPEWFLTLNLIECCQVDSTSEYNQITNHTLQHLQSAIRHAHLWEGFWMPS